MRLIPEAALPDLYARSDAWGAWRTLVHAALIAAGALLIDRAWGRWWLPVAVLLQGIFLVTLFGAMHECVHYSAFRTRRLNEIVAWVAGLGMLYNATYYRQFHFAHHRYAQDPARDPEILTAPPPRTRADYWRRASAIPFWQTRIANLAHLTRGRFASYPFIPRTAYGEIMRSARGTCVALGALLAASLWWGSAALVWYWLLPLTVALPLLRLYLLTEHTGCSEDDDGLSNTRTTISVWPVRFLMWNLPYHAEHHLLPSIPFHRLPAAHRHLKPHLRALATGYVRTNRALYAAIARER
jgi:fatty acid desaturase